jgi:hypothetical protein
VNAIPLLIPPLQTYVAAPPPLSVVLFPAQSGFKEAVAVIVGIGFTVTVIELVDVHPAALVPVTVYVVVASGVNATPLLTPPLQTYVAAPPPLSVVLFPSQSGFKDAAAVTVGIGFTVTVIELVDVHPAALVPVTVYVVVATGVNAIPLLIPPLQTYVAAPPPFSVVLFPSQSGFKDAVAVTVGIGLTVMVIVEVPVQPPASVPVIVYVDEDIGVKGTPLAGVFAPSVHV